MYQTIHVSLDGVFTLAIFFGYSLHQQYMCYHLFNVQNKIVQTSNTICSNHIAYYKELTPITFIDYFLIS